MNPVLIVVLVIIALVTPVPGSIHSEGFPIHTEVFNVKQHVELDCAGNLVCTISFGFTTSPGDTLILSGQSDVTGQEYCSRPTDDGGNTWPTTFARLDPSSHGGMSWVVNANPVSTITVTRCTGDHLRSLNVFDYPPSSEFSPAMSALNSGPTGYGVSLASVHTASIAVIATITTGLGSNCVSNSAVRGTYLGKVQFPGTAVNVCVHSMNDIGGTDNSVSNNDGGGLLDFVSIDLLEVSPPNVQTNSATVVTTTFSNGAVLNGNLLSLGAGASSVAAWFSWGDTQALGRNTSRQTLAVTGLFSDSIGSLFPNHVYYFRAHAENTTNSSLFSNGAILTFTTGNGLDLVGLFGLITFLVIVMAIGLIIYKGMTRKPGKGGGFG